MFKRLLGPSVLDQIVVSVSNFATTLILARALGPGDFGTFSLLWTTVLVLQGVSAALVTQPCRVLGVGADRSLDPGYRASLVAIQFVLALSLGGVAAAGALATPGIDVLTGLAFGLSILGLHAQELARSFGHTELAGTRVLVLDLLAYLPRVLGLAGLAWIGQLSVWSALAVIAVSFASGAVIGRPFVSPWSAAREELAATLIRHWRYGRWLLAESALFAASSYAYLYAVGLIIGREAAGGLAATQSLLNAANIIVMGALAIGVPLWRVKLIREGASAWRRAVTTIGAATIGTSGIVVLVVIVFSRRLLDSLFTPAYVDYAELVPILGVATALNAVNAVLNGAFRSLERPQVGVAARATSGFISLVVLYPLVITYGLLGAATGLLLVQVSWTATYLAAASKGLPAVGTGARLPRRHGRTLS